MKQLLLRIALAGTFLSAVASRLGFWGKQSGGWKSFVAYTSQVCAWASKGIIPVLAISATVLETIFALLLLVGYKTNQIAVAASVLTLTFALSMSYSMGLKEPLDYSVFVFSTAAFLLSGLKDYKWSIDAYLNNQQRKSKNKDIS